MMRPKRELPAPHALRCRLTWWSPGQNAQVRCVHYEDPRDHPDRHESGAAWVLVGYERDFVENARWL